MPNCNAEIKVNWHRKKYIFKSWFVSIFLFVPGSDDHSNGGPQEDIKQAMTWKFSWKRDIWFWKKSKYKIPLSRGNGLQANLLAELEPNCVNLQLWKGIGLLEKWFYNLFFIYLCFCFRKWWPQQWWTFGRPKQTMSGQTKCKICWF